MSKCLIIGYGSAGERHAGNAQTLGFDVAVVTSREVGLHKSYQDLLTAIRQESPDFAVIASPTYRHADELKQCIREKIPCLIEKPLAVTAADMDGLLVMDNGKALDYRVAYCLRYHPMVREAKSRIPSLGRLYSAQMTFGQYLPWWRKGTDYRKCYSASILKGGGVLLDSSHEIDLLHYLFGPVERVTAISGKISCLEIESDDVCAALCEMKSGQIVQIALDYLNQVPERRIIVNGENGSINLDLMNTKARFHINGSTENRTYDIDRNDLFLQELEDYAEHRERCLLPDLAESEITLRTSDAVRQSNREERWIRL